MSGRQQANMPSYSNDQYRQGSSSSSSRSFHQSSSIQMPGPPMNGSGDFDILDWHPAYLSCQRYFLDHAQHEPGTQALCALINIRLPFQWRDSPIFSSNPPRRNQHQNGQSGSSGYGYNGFSAHSQSRNEQRSQETQAFVSLVPYIRRMVVTGFDKDGILHGFFGDAWQAGISPLQDCERRNYLFAAKHGGWRSCKKQYDVNEEETVPFLKPLENVKPDELDAADKSWSSWLAMEDWMIGPRAPEDQNRGSGSGMSNNNQFYKDMPDSVPDQFGH